MSHTKPLNIGITIGQRNQGKAFVKQLQKRDCIGVKPHMMARLHEDGERFISKSSRCPCFKHGMLNHSLHLPQRLSQASNDRKCTLGNTIAFQGSL